MATSKKKAKTTTKRKPARKKAAKKTSRARKTTKKTRTVKITARKKKKTKSTKKPARKKPARKKTAKKVAKKPARKKKPAAKKAKKRPTKRTAKKSSARRTPAKKSTSDSSLIHGIEPYQPKRGEEYMNETQRGHFKAILNAWRQQLVDEISRTLHTMQDETVNHPDPNDRATQETDMSLELRSRDRERKLIRKIDETLSWIDSGDYGYCENCGVEIGIERLEARPTASLCIDCKTLDEIRERQMI